MLTAKYDQVVQAFVQPRIICINQPTKRIAKAVKLLCFVFKLHDQVRDGTRVLWSRQEQENDALTQAAGVRGAEESTIGEGEFSNDG